MIDLNQGSGVQYVRPQAMPDITAALGAAIDSGFPFQPRSDRFRRQILRNAARQMSPRRCPPRHLWRAAALCVDHAAAPVAAGSAVWAMAQMKPTSSRATAVMASGDFLPRAIRRR